MAISQAYAQLARVFTQRCFHLFVATLALVLVGPLASATPRGWIAIDIVESFVLVAAVAAFGRSPISVLIALLLALPMIGFQIFAGEVGIRRYTMVSTAFGAAFYATATIYLLAYVFRREVMTADKLYGAAAAYLMIGVLWAYFYGLVEYFIPGAFVSTAGKPQLDATDSIYFSFTVLTSTGFGDIVPRAPIAQSLTVAEQIIGVLFVAILVARLAGIYPPRDGPG
jgi:ion channel